MTDPINGSSVIAAVSASLAGTVAAPPAPGATVSPTAPPTAGANADPHAIAAVLNQHAQDLQTSLHFKVDAVTGQLVISVVDTTDNQVLLQIPSQEALAIAQSLERLRPQLMSKTV